MKRITRGIYWLRHKLIYWLDSQTTEALSMLMIACAAFVMALSWWMQTMGVR